jgi:hypothetical protein
MTGVADVEARGWNLEPILRAEKELRSSEAPRRRSSRIAKFEQQQSEAEEAKRRVREQEERAALDRLSDARTRSRASTSRREIGMTPATTIARRWMRSTLKRRAGSARARCCSRMSDSPRSRDAILATDN